MKFKTPFKVLTTAALIGTLSLSAVAPGAASAAQKTTQVSQKEAQENFSLDKVVLTKGDSKITISFTEYALYAGSDKLNGYELAFVTAKNGDIFSKTDYALYFKAGDTPAQVIERLSEADKAKTVEGIEEGTFDTEDGSLAPVTGEQAVEAAKADLAKAVEAAAATDIKDATVKAELAKAIEAAKAAAAKEDATKEELEAAKADLAKAVEAAKKADAEAALEAKVESVTAINAITVEVKFNKAVSDADATGISGGAGASNLSKYSVGGIAPTEVTLSKDGKTATLKFAASVEGENAAVVVNPIVLAADDNKKTERYAKTLTYKDEVKPEVTAIKATTGTDKVTSATIEFSEPVSTVEAIKVDGKALVSTTNYTLTPGATKLDLTGLDLDAAKEHTVEIVNLKDTAKTNSGAANVTSYITKTFTATVDKTAPTVASVEPKNDNKLVVTFSKPVDLDTTANASTYINLIDADLDNQTATLLTAGTKFEAVGTDKTKYVVELAASPFDTNETTAKYTVKFLANALTDLQGNKLAAATKDVTFTKDTVAPKLTNTAFRLDADDKVKELKFTFDEDVTLASGVTTLGTLLDSTNVVNVETGVKTNLTDLSSDLAAATLTVKDNVITATVATPTTLSGKYEFKLAADKVKDTSLNATTNLNKVADFTLDFGAIKENETFKATGASATVVDKANVITVNFAEAVKGGTGEGSATLTSAYTLNGKALPKGSKITLDSTQKVATIVVPAGTIETTDATAILNVKDIVSKDGKKQLVEYTKTISVTDNVAPEVKTATLTADNKLVVGFSEDLKADVTLANIAAELEVYINGHKVTSTPTPVAGTGSDNGKYVIDLGSLLSHSTDTVLAIDGTNDITVATGSDVTATFSLKSSSLIDSIKLKTVTSPADVKDVAENVLVGGTEITVK